MMAHAELRGRAEVAQRIRTKSNAIRVFAGIGSTALAMLLLGGCASSDAQQPTHRWVSAKNSSSVEYHADNAYCTQSAGTTGQRAFAVNSPEYQQYVECMNAKGYALSTIGESTVSTR